MTDTRPRPRGNATDPAATAARIVDAARTCFERYGIAKTTIEDIARAAGVSRPTVYKHFAGKEQIVEHISLAEMEKVQAVLRTRLSHHTGFADRITEAVLLSVQVSAENPYVRRFVQDMEATAHTQEPSSPYQVRARARWHTLLGRAHDAGDMAGDLDIDDVVAWLSLSQVMLLATMEQIGADEARLRRFIRRFVVDPLLAERGR